MVVHDMLIAHGKLKAGEWLLVTGISAGVGVAALQTAKALGAKVIGTSGSAEKLDKLKALGLDAVSAPLGDFAEAVRGDRDKGVNLVVNNVGGSVFAGDHPRARLRGQAREPSATWTACLKSEIDIEALPTKAGLTLFRRCPPPAPQRRQRAVDPCAASPPDFFLCRAAEIKPDLIDRCFPSRKLPRQKPTWNPTRRSVKIAVRILG